MPESVAETTGPDRLLSSAASIETYQSLLKNLPIFGDVDFDRVLPILARCAFKSYGQDEVLLSPSVPNDTLYILLSGKLNIIVNSVESTASFFVHPGEFVGEVSILDKQPPTALVTAAERSDVLCIHETILWSDLFQLPSVARNVLKQIAGRMRQRNAAIEVAIGHKLRLKHIEKELRIAQELQLSMLPSAPLFPAHPMVDVAGLIKPAREVGGDLYDAFCLDDHRLCIAIGDVAGKGIPAALFMVRSITLIRLEMAKHKADLTKAIAEINQELCRDNPQCMFVTLVLGVLDLTSGVFSYANCGHSKPFVGQPGTGYLPLPKLKGPILGINEYARFEIGTCHLSHGDTLLLYTDGVTEAHNPALEEFGESRLMDSLNRLPIQSSGDLTGLILQEVQDFAGDAEQADDLTLLALTYRPGSSPISQLSNNPLA